MHHAMSCRCDFDHASPDLRTPGHKQSTSKSKLQTQPAAGHVHMTVTASSNFSKSRVPTQSHITCRVPSHIWRETSKSPTFHRRPSLSITIVRTRSGSGSVPITAASAAVRPRSPRSPRRAEHGARCTRRCRTRNTHAHTPRALPWACSRVLSTVVSPWIVAVSVPIRRAMINDS